MDAERVGVRIAVLRKAKGLSQKGLSELLNISFQAISKWECGKTLPDTAILVRLAKALNTSVDDILSGGKTVLGFRGNMSVERIREGISCLKRMGLLLGRDNILYRSAVNGISGYLSEDAAAILDGESLPERLLMEAILCNMRLGYHFDRDDIKLNFKSEASCNEFCDLSKKYDIKDGLTVDLVELTLLYAEQLAGILNSDEKLHRTLTPNQPISSVDGKSVLQNVLEWMKTTNSLSYAILTDGAAAGLLSIAKINRNEKTASIGYWLGSEYWSRGIATKAVRLALEKSKKMGLKNIFSRIPKSNDPQLKETDSYSAKIWQSLNAAPTETQDFTIYNLKI